MKRYWVWAAIAFQLGVLAVMAGQREYIVATGETVYLRTAPIDPRDLFRGDFVRLHYEPSMIYREALDEAPDNLPKGTQIYARLQIDRRGLASVQGFSLHEPEQGPFLRGFTTYAWHNRWPNAINVKYGIEAYFVQQGKGREMERRLGNRNSIQIPLEMELAVSDGGTAIIKGYRWSPLGIGLQVIAREPVEQGRAPPVPMLKLSLLNASQEPLALVKLPNSCSFSLAAADRAVAPVPQDVDPCFGVQVQGRDILVLQPEQSHTFDFDLAAPRWQVVGENGELKNIAELPPGSRFRLVYRPPGEDAVAGLPHSERIWHGNLPSPAFTAVGRVD